MDIVERLRNGCTCNFESTPCGAEEECQAAFDGADEIEGLRKALLDAVGFVSRADCFFLRKTTTDTLKGIPDCGRDQGPRLDDRGDKLDGN